MIMKTRKASSATNMLRLLRVLLRLRKLRRNRVGMGNGPRWNGKNQTEKDQQNASWNFIHKSLHDIQTQGWLRMRCLRCGSLLVLAGVYCGLNKKFCKYLFLRSLERRFCLTHVG